jgi:1-deoxy-D-xylulose-5-phosphate synthase
MTILDRLNSPEDLRALRPEELPELASEIRTFLIEQVSRTGGHLSPNLGVVELTIALHRVFHTPEDNLIWDVGHQAYVHKIITGRKDRFSALRMKDGLSGYPSPLESPHDTVHAGHSSTSLSIAAGIARAKLLSGDTSATVAVIGDGAFTSGLVYEALNEISHSSLPVLIVLNDNGMSISKNVGGIAKYLQMLLNSRNYFTFKERMQHLMKRKIPFIGSLLVTFLYHVKEFFKAPFVRRNFFQDMGLSYIGPIDGHNIRDLERAFREVQGMPKPVIVHAVTMKGKGYQPSEENPGKYHGISGNTGVFNDQAVRLKPKADRSYSQLFGEIVTRAAEKEPKLFVITAAMKSGTGLMNYAKNFPDRFSDVGIAEEHAVVYAYGLSLQGFKPVVAIYSTFLQRAYDQLVHDIGIGKGRVIFCLDRAGLVPGDGETHQGVFDIAYLRMIPNFTLMLPGCAAEFRMMLEGAIERLDGPVAIRYPKDEAVDYPEYDAFAYPIVSGEGVLVRDGKDVIVVAAGATLGIALEAAKSLEKKNIYAAVFNLRFACPISQGTFEILSADDRPVLVLEEGVKRGGIGEALTADVLARRRKRFETVAVDDGFPGVDTRSGLLDRYSLTPEKIGNKILSWFIA